jgi:hypothetical protein
MKIKSKVSKQGDRKIINLPCAVKDEFEIGETVYIEKGE